MSRIDEWRERLRSARDWRGVLRENSGLPGPRGNLELAQAAAEELSVADLRRLLHGPQDPPTNTPEEFLAFCGVLGLGSAWREGDAGALDELRRLAADPRWRIREAVALALQREGDRDLTRAFDVAEVWATGTPLEQRAAVAAVSEPRFLKQPAAAGRALDLLDRVTASLEAREGRSGEDVRVLRKGLGYCWSVAVSAAPERGKPRFERWLDSDDPDVRWVLRENLKKSRLERMDADWVARCRAALNS
jgi:hypothetical protein